MPPRFTDDELDKEVLFLLKQHRGKAHPVGRWEMVEKIFSAGAAAAHLRNDSNVADRHIRDSILRLLKAGVLICNMGDGQGSYLAETVDEYREFRTRYGSAAFDVIETIGKMDDAAAEEFPDLLQPRLL